MKTFTARLGCVVTLFAAVILIMLLAGCNALGGIPDSTVGALANAGGGCVKVTGVWGTGIVVVASADKGVIRNGEVTVAGECGGVTIRETKPVPPVKPAP